MHAFNRKLGLGNLVEPKQHHLPDYDYSRPAIYHVIIQCRRSSPPLSAIDSLTAQIMLSPEGECVWKAIEMLPTYFPFVRVTCYAIMPDHLHVLLHIGEQPPLPPERKRITLGKIVGKLTGRSTRDIHDLGTFHFRWQPDFYDVIIWDYPQYEAACRYMHNNPQNWLKDHMK